MGPGFWLFASAMAHVHNPSCTLQVGVEFLKNDIMPPTVVASQEACCASCTANSTCAFWTYEGQSGLCHLKNTNAPDASRDNATCVSGYVGVRGLHRHHIPQATGTCNR